MHFQHSDNQNFCLLKACIPDTRPKNVILKSLMLQTSSQHMEREGILWHTNNLLSQEQLPQTVSKVCRIERKHGEWESKRIQKNPP